MATGAPILLGTGIAAGTPFTIGRYALIVNTTPPTIANGRLAQKSDVIQSITAPGVTAALRTLVLGNGVGEGSGNARSILLGDVVVGIPGAGVNAAQNQTLIGVDITQLAGFVNCDTTILIGNAPVFGTAAGNFGNTVYLGHNQVVTAAGGAVDTFSSVLIGNSARIRGGDAVGIGGLVVVAAESVAVGKAVTGAGTQSVGVGKGASIAGNNAVAIGRRAEAANTRTISIGFFTSAFGLDSIAIGATDGAFDNCIAIGRGSLPFAANQLVIGQGLVGSASSVTVMRIGPLAETAYPGLTWRLTDSDGGVANQAAPNFTLRGGSGTGTGAGGAIRLQTAVIVGAGAAQQAVVERFAVLPSTGAAGAAILQFSNFTTGVAAAALPAIVNAPLARQPIDYIPVLTPAGQGWIPVF